jgi:hypothetical protein
VGANTTPFGKWVQWVQTPPSFGKWVQWVQATTPIWEMSSVGANNHPQLGNGFDIDLQKDNLSRIL